MIFELSAFPFLRKHCIETAHLPDDIDEVREASIAFYWRASFIKLTNGFWIDTVGIKGKRLYGAKD
jgi:hypothetical protein